MSTPKAGMKQLDLGPTGKTVAQNLYRLRTHLHLTYSALSRVLAANGHKIPELGLRRIESQARRVDADDLVALAIALGVSPLTLLLPPIADQGERDTVTGLGESLDTNVLWLWALGDEPLHLPAFREHPKSLREVDRFRTVAKPAIEPRGGGAATWSAPAGATPEEQAALERDAWREVEQGQGIRPSSETKTNG